MSQSEGLHPEVPQHEGLVRAGRARPPARTRAHVQAHVDVEAGAASPAVLDGVRVGTHLHDGVDVDVRVGRVEQRHGGMARQAAGGDVRQPPPVVLVEARHDEVGDLRDVVGAQPVEDAVAAGGLDRRHPAALHPPLNGALHVCDVRRVLGRRRIGVDRRAPPRQLVLLARDQHRAQQLEEVWSVFARDPASLLPQPAPCRAQQVAVAEESARHGPRRAQRAPHCHAVLREEHPGPVLAAEERPRRQQAL